MRSHPTVAIAATLALLLLSPVASAQGWLDVIKDKATQAVGQAGEALDKDGDAVPPEQQDPQGATGGATAAPAKPARGAKPAAGGQPNLTAVKSDFVPGEKTLFYDDLSDMAGDEPPPHWKVRGGTAELYVGGDVRQLNLATHGMVVAPNLKGLPKNFTLEMDLQFGALTGNGNGMIWRFTRLPDGPQTLMINARVQEGGTRLIAYAGNADNPENVADTIVQVDPAQPIQFALWVQDGRIRLYLNGKRAMDVNQIELEQINFVEVEAVVEGDTPGAYAAIRRVRFAETTPDFSRAISSGRYVTHGILFDTDSDRIKPESAAVIRMVASGLQATPSMNLKIEGYTDSTGDAAHNLDLSRRRAEAVKSVLVSQFAVDSARLTTEGLGASKPIASNDTPQGRADNRRVEFVRL